MKHFSYICLFLLAFSSCSLRAVREAQDVVAEADSLWAAGQMYGRDSGDSATLAQAYEQLGNLSPLRFPLSVFRFPLSASYAHACYHYGRLLRERENPVAAMKCFINATHSHTRDYHILGRVYSNMGDICHLAGEFELSYDMFEQSADMFLRNGDTLNYYYALNDMAYEMAEQGKKHEALSLLDYIPSQSSNSYLNAKNIETKITLYKNLHQYETVLAFADSLELLNFHEPLVLISKAQSFCYLNQFDSATYYAQRTIDVSNDLFNLDNAYYILIHCDSINNGHKVYTLSANRSDVKKVLKLYHGKLSQAVQLLEQDLNRKPDLRWLYAILATAITFAISIIIYIYRKRQKHTLLSQKIDELEQVTSTIQERHDELTERYQIHHLRIEDEINSRCSMLKNNDTIKKNLAWKNYGKMCKIVDKQFYMLASKLRDKHALKETEVRICVLTLLDCGSEQMAELLYKSRTSIGTLKRRVANKLGTTSGDLRRYLIENECIN